MNFAVSVFLNFCPEFFRNSCSLRSSKKYVSRLGAAAAAAGGAAEPPGGVAWKKSDVMAASKFF